MAPFKGHPVDNLVNEHSGTVGEWCVGSLLVKGRGQILLSGGIKADFEDRLLAHLHMVIGNKLRRGEPVYFSWRDEQSTGGGRTSVWIHPSASMTFEFHSGRTPSLNRAWLEALMYTANSNSGLHVVPEPASGAGVDAESAA